MQEEITAYEQEDRSIAYLYESGVAQDIQRTQSYFRKRQCYSVTQDLHEKERINAIDDVIVMDNAIFYQLVDMVKAIGSHSVVEF